MENTAAIAKVVAQAGLLVLLGPLVTGFIQKLKARLQCRQGASLWQPYRDLAKLLRKGTVQSDSASPFFRAIPVLVLAATVTTTVMLPVLWAPAGAARLPMGDAILLLALLALARFLVRDRGVGCRRGFRRNGRFARNDGWPAGRAGFDDGGLFRRRGRRDN